MRKVFPLIICVLLCAALNAQTQFRLVYEKQYAGNPVVKVLSNGNYLVAGDSGMFCINPWGGLQWSCIFQQGNLSVKGVKEDGDNLLCVAHDPSNPSRASVFKLDSTHNIIWQKEVVHAQPFSVTQVCFTSDNHILLGCSGPLLIKLDTAANLIWAKSMPMAFSGIWMVDELNDGNYIFGTVQSTVCKIDTAGNPIWQHAYDFSYPTSLSYFSAVSELPGGNIIFSGTHGTNWGEGDVRIVKTDANGNLLRDTTYFVGGGYTRLLSRAGTRTPDHGLIISLHNYYSNPADPQGTYSNGGLAYIDTNGVAQWFRFFTGTGCFFEPTVVPGDGFIVPVLYLNLMALIKVDSLGYDVCATTTPTVSVGPPAYDTTFGLVMTSATVVVNVVTTLQLIVANPVFSMPCYLGQEEEVNIATPKIYPNPALNGQFTVVAQDNQIIEHLRIYNSLGELVFDRAFLSHEATVTENLSVGMYHVMITCNNRETFEQLIILE